MKRIFNWMLAASVCTAGLAGCTQDKPGGGADEGEATGVEVVLQFAANELPTASEPEGETRATNDTNAKLAEATIVSADLYIYSGNGDFLRREHLAAGDFSTTNSAATGSGYDEYAATRAITTTTGQKYFHVGVNLPSSVASTLEGQHMSTAATIVQTYTRDWIKPGTDGSLPNGLPMFTNGEPVSANLVADATANRVSVQVKRVVAKVTVQKGNPMTQSGAAGAILNLQWAVNNLNIKGFLKQGPSPNYADPNWTTAQYTAGATTDFSQAVAADYVVVDEATPAPSTTSYHALYAYENTSQNKTQKELTRITVRAQFVPQRWIAQGGYNNTTKAEPTVSDNPNYTASPQTPVTFYTVVPRAGEAARYFANQTDANNYSADNGNATVNTFTDGYCYWNFNLNNGHNGEVYRNDYYQCRITSIMAPGNASPNITSPDAPPTTSTTITAVVQIVYWNAVPMEDKQLVP